MNLEKIISDHWKFIRKNSYRAAAYYKLPGDEIYAMVLERIATKQHLYDMKRDFLIWVRTMIRNICLDECDKVNAYNKIFTRGIIDESVHHHTPTAESKDSLEKVAEYIKAKYKYWEVVKMVVEGYSQEEISKKNGRAISSNQSTLYEIRRNLKQFSSTYLN